MSILSAEKQLVSFCVKKGVYDFESQCIWFSVPRLTHPSAVSLGQFGRIAGDQFVLLILPAVTVNTTDTQKEKKSATY